MTRVLFVCHGNICRSPMAEFVMKKLVREAGCGDRFRIDSCAVSDEEHGSGIYGPAQRKLREKGVPFDVHRARCITQADYRAADLVVSRAGAGSISELQLLGKPVILVPSPNVAEDHQRKNALALADRDAALMILDADAAAKLPEAIVSLSDDKEARDRLSRNILDMALPDSDEKIVDAALELIK